MQYGLFVRLCLRDDLAAGVDDLRLTAVVQPMGVFANAVHADPIGALQIYISIGHLNITVFNTEMDGVTVSLRITQLKKR